MSESRYSPWVRRLHWLVFMLVAAALMLIYIHIANRAWNPGAWDFLGSPFPHAAHPNRQFANMLEGIHENFGNLLMYLAALHAAAALIHHFVQRDDVLRRMLPAARTED
ncbi:MAG: cytochrome b/b6 domain-containing protein [Rhodanobacteraceae bacterium]